MSSTLTGWQREISLELGPLPRYAVMALGTPTGAQVINGLLINSFETSADLLRFTRNNCSVSSSTEVVTDGQKAALGGFSNVDSRAYISQNGFASNRVAKP